MRRVTIFVALLSCATCAYELRGEVVAITDGDSITLLDDDYQQHKIRLYGIDAPERKQPYGKKAKDMLAVLIEKQRIIADCEGKDRYHRHVCTLYINEMDINAEMVRRGGAWVYRRYYRGDAYYVLENEAKSAKRGLWHTSEYQAVPPWEWRKQQSKTRKSKPE